MNSRFYRIRHALIATLSLSLTAMAMSPQGVNIDAAKKLDLKFGKVQGTITFMQSLPVEVKPFGCSSLRVSLTIPGEPGTFSEKTMATVIPTQTGKSSCSFNMNAAVGLNYAVRLNHTNTYCANGWLLRLYEQYSPSSTVKLTQAGETATRNITISQVICEEPPQ